MAETPADVKRDIELTRERISSTLSQLEAKTNVMQIVKDHPWPALGVAFAAGLLLSGSKADVKAASATLVATKGTGSRLGTVLDDVVANLMGGLSLAFQQRVDGLVDELKTAIGGTQQAGGASGSRGGMGAQRFADADVTPSATRGDGYAAAGTTGASESRSALGSGTGASAGGSGSLGNTLGGSAPSSGGPAGGTLSQAGSQGTNPTSGGTGRNWSPQGSNLVGNRRAD